MIAAALYTGPMFVAYNRILRRFPKQLYEVFVEKDNLFSAAIFVLVSALQKLFRCMRIPPRHDVVPRPKLQLPKSFTNADENGCKGYYCEFGFMSTTDFGFMSTTAGRNVAVH
jgi:hypothetical protein